jgi:diguanylate cyclase (GGDEF)-like protein
MGELLFDTKTLILCTTLVNYYMCAGLYVYRKSQKTYPGFGIWMNGAILITASYSLFALRGALPDFVTILLANTLAASSAVLRVEGMRRFITKGRFNPWGLSIPVLIFILFAYFTYVDNNILVRNTIFSVTTTALALRTFSILKSNRWDESRQITNFFGASLIVYSVAMMARAIGWFFDPANRELHSSTLINSAYFFLVLILDINWSIAFILLNTQRVNLENSFLTAQLDELASTDALTGVYNRRRFFELSNNEVLRAQRYGHNLSMLICDLDLFKDINDTYGHAAGDDVLRKVAAVCRQSLRQQDVMGRFGGDEFIILFPETDLTGATDIAKRLKHEIHELPFEWGAGVRASISYGAAQMDSEHRSMDALMAHADSLLYEMKRKRKQSSSRR